MRKYVQITLVLFTFFILGIVTCDSISEAKLKTYKISTSTKPCDAKYKKSSAYNKNTKHYFLIRSYLEKLKKTGGTLVLKKGNYKVCSTLYVPSNVTIKLNAKAKVIKTSSSGTKECKPTKYLFQLATEKQAKKKSIKAYKASRNVSIIGASGSTIDLGSVKGAVGISMAHNYNINVQKISFKNRYGGSYIALSGVKKVSIDSNKFYNGKNLSSASDYFDIRMEIPNSSIDSLQFSWSKLDNTKNENILIRNNTFTGMLGAIGTTKYAYPGIGKKKVKTVIYQNNIKIQKNKFKSLSGTAIKGIAWSNANISNNEFYHADKSKKIPYGVYLYGVSEPTVTNNTFRYVNRPIRFSFAQNKGSGAQFSILKSSISTSKISLIKKNTVKDAGFYYVLHNDGKDKRIIYYVDKGDNNLTISTTSSTYREKYKDYASYETNTKDYFLFQSHMEQLEECGGGTLTVKAGTYSISNGIHVPSNITVIFEAGVVLKKIAAKYTTSLTVPKAMFVFVAPSLAKAKGTVKGYNGTSNVKFTSSGRATIDCNMQSPGQGIILGHTKNITFSRIDFRRQKGYHFIELNSSNNVTIEDCTFEEFKAVPKEPNNEETDMTYKECINIDGTDFLTNGFNYDWSAHDKTVCKDIIIRNCKFMNIGTAIGSHTYIANGNKQAYHENIKIYDNTIENTLNSGIRVMNWKNAEITNNTFKYIGYEPLVNQYGYKYHGIYLRGVVEPLIKNNTFDNCKWPIYIKRKETAKPAASKYPDTISSMSMERWMDMLDNTLIDCSSGSYSTVDDIKYDKSDFISFADAFPDEELPENYKSMRFLNITHENR